MSTAHPIRNLIRQVCRAALLAAVSVLLITAQARAESDCALYGTVHDRANGAPVEGAVLRLEGTAWCAQSDAAGRFAFYSVPPGSYRLAVERAGYRPRIVADLAIVEGFTRSLYIDLEPEPVTLPGQSVSAARADLLMVHRVERPRDAGTAPPTVASLLAQVPGVRVYGSSETPGGTRVSVGGEPAERVAVLLDGVPLSRGPDGAVNLDIVPANAVRAVEVHSGPQSAAAGDAAVGGVVNLVTSEGPAEAVAPLELTARLGRFTFYNGGVAGPIPLVGSGARFAAEGFGRGDRFAFPDGDSSAQRDGVGLQGERLFARWCDTRSRFDMAGFYYHAENGTPGPLQQSTPDATLADRRWRWQGSWRHQRRSDLATTLWFEESCEHYRSPQLYTADSEMRERYAGARGEWRLTASRAWTRLTIEGQYRRLEGIDHLRPAQSFGVREQYESALRGAGAFSTRVLHGVADLRLAAALDVDDRSHPVFSPRADLVWRHHTGVQIRGGLGRAFRRPGLTALFWKTDAYAAGNPDLRPERAAEWDVAFGWARGETSVESRYFERDVTDIIIWERDFSGRYVPQNLRSARIVGREDHVGTRIGRAASVSCDYTHVYTNGYDASGEPNSNGCVLMFTPRHTHEVRLSLRSGRLAVTGTGRWVSARYTRRANTKELPAYRLFDAAIDWAWRRAGPALSAGLRIDNLTNEHVELLERYPVPGTAWSVMTTIRF